MYLTIQVKNGTDMILNSPIWISHKSYREDRNNAHSINRIVKSHRLYRIAMKEINERGISFPAVAISNLELRELKIEDELEMEFLSEIISAKEFEIHLEEMYIISMRYGKVTDRDTSPIWIYSKSWKDINMQDTITFPKNYGMIDRFNEHFDVLKSEIVNGKVLVIHGFEWIELKVKEGSPIETLLLSEIINNDKLLEDYV